MPGHLLNSLISVSLNLAGMLVIYSIMAYALLQMRWGRGSSIAVVVTILAAQLFWIIPAKIGPSLYFSNWMATALGLVIFCLRARTIPKQLEDSARLDGCGQIGIYWHILLPFVRLELILIAICLAVAAALALCVGLTSADRVDPFLLLFGSIPGWNQFSMRTIEILASLMLAVPVIGTFFIARRYLLVPAE